MSKSLKIIDYEPESVWYTDGLSFKCTECGKCCTGSPGYVWVTEEEIEAIADYLHLSVPEFSNRYVRRIEDRYALLEDHKNYDCAFLKDKKCQIYPVRPKQCRTFPWWPKNLKSKAAWDEAATYCEGINQAQPVVPLSVIQTQLSIQQSK